MSENNPKTKKEDSLTQVFMRYRGILERMLAPLVKPHDIEDIVQETFVKTYEKNLTHQIHHPKTYLYQTAKHLAFNHLAKKANQLEELTGDFADLDVSSEWKPLEADIESKEKFQLFCRAVRELPPQCRRAFILKRIYGLSQKEIARYLEISERTVEGHIAKGMVKCAQYLKQHGYPVQPDVPAKTKAREIK